MTTQAINRDDAQWPHQQAKPDPDYSRFCLADVLQASLEPDNPDARERAANSLRCIEVIHAARPPRGRRMGGVMVPDSLFAREIRAAVTTTSTAVGLIDRELTGDDFIGSLVEQGDILPFLDVKTGLSAPIAVPRITATNRPAAAEENSTAPDPVAFTLDTVQETPKMLRGYFVYSPEVEWSTRRRMGIEGVTEVLRQMADYMETQIWRGTGANAQVQGLEARITADRTANYPSLALGRDHAWELLDALNGHKVRRSGRFFAATREMSKLLNGIRMEDDGGMYRRLHNLPVVDTTRPSEDGDDGRLWLVSGRDVIVGMFGEDFEVVMDRAQGSEVGAANYRVLVLRQWDLALRHVESMHVLKVA